MKYILRLTLYSVLLATPCFPAMADGDGVELVENMRSLQYFAHKTHLSIEAGNMKLAGFYAHEIEEVIEVLEKVESYHGHPIAELVKTILLPRFESFESAIKHGTPGDATAKFDGLLEGCNRCHESTEHGFIAIRKNSANPYLQSFAPKSK